MPPLDKKLDNKQEWLMKLRSNVILLFVRRDRSLKMNVPNYVWKYCEKIIAASANRVTYAYAQNTNSVS